MCPKGSVLPASLSSVHWDARQQNVAQRCKFGDQDQLTKMERPAPVASTPRAPCDPSALSYRPGRWADKMLNASARLCSLPTSSRILWRLPPLRQSGADYMLSESETDEPPEPQASPLRQEPATPCSAPSRGRAAASLTQRPSIEHSEIWVLSP